MYENLETAVETARTFPKLGQFIARLDLVTDQGISFAKWGGRTHMTVWGEAEKLCAFVIEILPVRQ